MDYFLLFEYRISPVFASQLYHISILWLFTRPSLKANYNVTDRLNVDVGINYIVHKLAQAELKHMKSNDSQNSQDSHGDSQNSGEKSSREEESMRKDAAFSDQVKYYVIQVTSSF